jgi:SRSO17 transposase
MNGLHAVGLDRLSRKDGCATDHVAGQYLGSVGKIDKDIVAVTTL